MTEAAAAPGLVDASVEPDAHEPARALLPVAIQMQRISGVSDAETQAGADGNSPRQSDFRSSTAKRQQIVP
jgi:hypothetical protein